MQSFSVTIAPTLPWMTFGKAGAVITICCQPPKRGTGKTESKFWPELRGLLPCTISLHWNLIHWNNIFASIEGFICRWNKENHFVWWTVIRESAEKAERRFFFTKPDHSMSWLTAHLLKTVLAKRQGEQSGRGRGGKSINQWVSGWELLKLKLHFIKKCLAVTPEVSITDIAEKLGSTSKNEGESKYFFFNHAWSNSFNHYVSAWHDSKENRPQIWRATIYHWKVNSSVTSSGNSITIIMSLISEIRWFHICMHVC